MYSYLRKNNLIPAGILLAVTYILYLSYGWDNIIIILSVIWLTFGLKYRLDERIFLALALVSLLFSFPFFLVGNMEIAEKFAVWQFGFIIIGALRLFLEKYFYKIPAAKKMKNPVIVD